jgi:hypothetical protein
VLLVRANPAVTADPPDVNLASDRRRNAFAVDAVLHRAKSLQELQPHAREVTEIIERRERRESLHLSVRDRLKKVGEASKTGEADSSTP